MTGSNIMKPLVLKIGGSLAKTGRARAVLDLVVRSPRQVVIVPGGGAHADGVRVDQVTRGFSDAEAHKRAILAMHQIAADFQLLEPRLKAVESLQAMTIAWAEHRTPVWLPWIMVEHETSISQDWTITSDSLAAWLAGQIENAEVALVKSCAVPAGASLANLADAGITDPQFPIFVAQGHLNWHMLGAGDDARLDAILAGGAGT